MPFDPIWAITDDLATFIAEHFRANEPRVAVEFGSGRSTVLMSELLGDQGYLIAFEQSDEYAAQTEELAPDASVARAPIRDGWYDQTVVDAWLYGSDQIDFVLVDGPGPCKDRTRRPAMGAVYDRLAPSALVVVDDGNRQSAREDVESWVSEFDNLLSVFVPNERGMFLVWKLDA